GPLHLTSLGQALAGQLDPPHDLLPPGQLGGRQVAGLAGREGLVTFRAVALGQVVEVDREASILVAAVGAAHGESELRLAGHRLTSGWVVASGRCGSTG